MCVCGDIYILYILYNCYLISFNSYSLSLSSYGYAHLILKLEWAKPSNRDAGKEGGLSGNSFVSGYGKG